MSTYTAEDVIKAHEIGYSRGIYKEEPLTNEQVLQAVELAKKANEETEHG